MTIELQLRGLLHKAGIPGRAVAIPNRYWPEHPDYDDVRESSPWLRVFTTRGVIVIGWRKRVISIDWSDGAFDAMGGDVVERDDITHGPYYCHAWSYEQAAQCLERLWGES